MPPSARIAVIGNNWFPDRPGGLDRYVYELVHTLAADSVIDLFGLGLPAQSTVPSLHLHNLAHPDESLGRRLIAAFQKLHTLKSAPINAINIHFALHGLVALPHLPQNVPVIGTFHGPWAIESQREGNGKLNVWLKQQMENAVYRRCDRFIVLSKAFGEILHQEYGIAWDKIRIIPGGVDIQRFPNNRSRRQARQQMGWPQDRFILFTPRRLVHRMGLDKLLSAIAQLPLHRQNLWLAIAGKGPLRQTLEQQVAELEIENQVRFLGFLPDEQLPIAYQAADLTVMPSQSLEGFGLVLLESLSSGTPALCTPVGGMPEVIASFAPELITASPSEGAIAATLEAILTGTVQLPDRGACRDYATTHFSWFNIAQKVKTSLFLEGL